MGGDEKIRGCIPAINNTAKGGTRVASSLLAGEALQVRRDRRTSRVCRDYLVRGNICFDKLGDQNNIASCCEVYKHMAAAESADPPLERECGACRSYMVCQHNKTLALTITLSQRTVA